MENIGLDLHKRESQLCGISEEGRIWERSLLTSRERFAEVLGGRRPARILVESSTESEWVARHLEGLGHEVIVADPSFAPMYASRSRRVKTNRRDARTLAEACRLGAYRRAHRVSDARRQLRAELTVRQALVRTRTRYVSVLRTLIRQEGLRLPSGAVEHVLPRLAALALPPHLAAELAPLVPLLEALNGSIAAADERLAGYAATDLTIARLTTAPGIGPVTATAFVAVLDDITRFERAHHLEAFLGLTPSEASSADKRQRGRISKAGHPGLRALLVEAAWRLLRSKQTEAQALRHWAEQIATRRGRSIAAVALARRLAGILYAMWRDGTRYRGHGASQPAAA